MDGERDGDDRESRDYAGKDGGHSGGPGGHARDRLEEMIAQRVPGGGDEPEEPEEPEGPEDASGRDEPAEEYTDEPDEEGVQP